MKQRYALTMIIVLILGLLLTACVGEMPPTPTAVADISPIPTATFAAPASPTTTPRPATTQALAASPKNEHRLFIEPDDGLAPVVNAINGAKISIQVKMYLLSEPTIIDALKAAVQQRSIRVQVMLEQSPVGSGPGNTMTYQSLQNGGVMVRWANPSFRLTHEKSMVIDNAKAFVMTMNFTRAAFKNNREYGIITTKPTEIKEIQDAFLADWERTQFTPPTDSALLWSNVNSRQKILSFIGGAKKTLVLQQEEMQDSQVQLKLVEAATRGVKVRVLVAGDPLNPDKLDANRPGEEQLKAGGVEVKIIAQPYMHAKIYIADDSKAIICSENVSTSSLNNNRELGIIVTDSEIVRRSALAFETDWRKGTSLVPRQ